MENLSNIATLRHSLGYKYPINSKSRVEIVGVDMDHKFVFVKKGDFGPIPLSKTSLTFRDKDTDKAIPAREVTLEDVQALVRDLTPATPNPLPIPSES